MRMSASVSVRVPGWNSVKTDLITTASKCLLKNWRACYAEYHGNEQVLLHQKLHGHALQVQQNHCSYPASAWKGSAERRSVHSDVKEPQTCSSVLVRQDIFQSLRKALCTGTSVHEGREKRTNP